jgi:hypothetical protein
MKTDVPLKRLTKLCPEDLLALLDAPAGEVIGVETLQLPAGATSLDTVLRLRDGDGRTFLHLIEGQGYTDPQLLWRVLHYATWLGQHYAERPILVSIIYLNPGDDVGDMLEQAPTLPGGWSIRLHCLRLWEQDASKAMASGRPGWMALLPLLNGATAEMVEQAARRLLAREPSPAQGDLLAALGIFAEPLFSTERFIRLVTKERLMGSDLISYLLEDKLVEFAQREAEFAQREADSAQREAALKAALEQQRFIDTLQQMVEDAIIARFPAVPAITVRRLRTIREPQQLEQLHRAVLAAVDLAALEQLLTAAENGAA